MISKYILEILTTGECNKRCGYCYNEKFFTKKFNKNNLYKLDSYKHRKELNKFELFGGEIGTLSKEDLTCLFKKLSEFENFDRIELFSNGLFFKKYNLMDFPEYSKFKWELTIHLTSIDDFNILNNMYMNDIFIWNYLIILFENEDFKLLDFILNSKTKNVNIKFRFPYFEEKFITIDIFNSWKLLRKNEKIKNIDKDFSHDLFLNLLDENLTFERFKILIKINNMTFIKDKVDLCENQTVKESLI